MHEVLSGLLMRIVFLAIPLLLLADLSRALGRSVSRITIFMALAVPIVGLVADARRAAARRGRARKGLTLPQPKTAQPFQFSLRTLLIVMALASIYCGFRFSAAVRQRATLSTLRSAGVPIAYDHRTASWLEGIFGPEMFGTVRKVTLRSDAEVAQLAALPQVTQILVLGSGITDEAVEHLATLRQLEQLTVYSTCITAAAIDRLRNSLPNCEVAVFPAEPRPTNVDVRLEPVAD